MTSAVLVLVLAAPLWLLPLPIVEASDVETTATLVAAPDPIGIGQTIKLVGDIDPNPLISSFGLGFGYFGYSDIKIIITYPDGHNVTAGPFFSNIGGGVTLEFVPDRFGSYNASFAFSGETLSDGNYYQSCEALVNFTVQEEPVFGPVGTFTFDPETPEVDETVNFDASNSSDLNGNIVNYNWDYGDHITDSGVNSSHVYSSADVYTVTLTTVDNDGIKDITTKLVTVVPKPLPPEASFTFSPASPEVGQSVIFNASNSSDVDSTILNYFWDFGDGSIENQTIVDVVAHAYTSEGTYNVTLTITDDTQLTGNITKSITVSPPPKEAPEASFTYSPLNPDVNETITFDASVSSDVDGTIVSYFWDFGDGTTKTGITTTHAYALNGTYTVTLTVTDNDDLTNTTTKTINNVVPEFPSWMLVPLFLVFTFFAAFIKRDFSIKHSKKHEF